MVLPADPGLSQSNGKVGDRFAGLRQGTNVSGDGVLRALQIPRITAPFERRFGSGLRTRVGLDGPHRATALILRLHLEIPWFWYVFVLTLEMMPLNKSYDAIVHDVEDARFVEHFKHVLVFRTGLEPQQRHAFLSMANHEFHHGLLGSVRRKEKHHDFGLEALLDGRTNGSAEDGAACVARMDRHQAPSLPVQIVNGSMGWFLGIQSSSENVDGGGPANRTNNGWVCIPEHGYLLLVFFFNHCSSPQNSSIKATRSVMIS